MPPCPPKGEGSYGSYEWWQQPRFPLAQATTQGHTAYWVSPRVLMRYVVPALSLCHVILALLKFYFTSKAAESFTPSVIVDKLRVVGKVSTV